MKLPRRILESWIVKGFLYLVVAVLVAAIYFALVAWYYSEAEWGWRVDDKRAAFGSSFGALAAIFSGLAFLGVILTIRQSARQFRDERLANNLTELFKLYSSEPMLRAVQGLHLWSENISMCHNVTLNAGAGGNLSSLPDASNDLTAWWKENGFSDEYFVAIHDAYLIEVKKFERLLASGAPTADTIHNWRRQVSHFYRYLALLRCHELLPKEFALAYWSHNDRKIIPKVLIPADAHLNRKVADKPLGSGDPKWELLEFYDESRKKA